MKNLRLLTVIGMLFSIGLFYTGCAEEVMCVNGTYADSICTCDAGYEGDDCTIESRVNWVGDYIANDSTNTSSFEITISNGTMVEEIIISNLIDGEEIIGIIETPTTMRFEGNTSFESGSGVLAGDIITLKFDYLLPDGTTFSPELIYTRK